MRFKFLSVATLLFMSLSLSAQAHEWLVKATPIAPEKGDLVKLELMATHYFNRDEEAEVLKDSAAYLIQNGKTTELTVTEQKDVLHLMSEFTMPEDGTAWIYAHRLAQPWSYTPDGAVPGTKADLAPEVAAQVTRTNTTEKFTKLLLNPSASDKTFSKPLGHRLEIVLLDNPATIKVGDEISIKTLYEGKNLITPIYATYTDFSGQMMTFAYYTESTDAEPKVKITAPGLWFIRAKHSVNPAANETFNNMAILMFEVK